MKKYRKPGRDVRDMLEALRGRLDEIRYRAESDNLHAKRMYCLGLIHGAELSLQINREEGRRLSVLLLNVSDHAYKRLAK